MVFRGIADLTLPKGRNHRQNGQVMSGDSTSECWGAWGIVLPVGVTNRNRSGGQGVSRQIWDGTFAPVCRAQAWAGALLASRAFLYDHRTSYDSFATYSRRSRHNYLARFLLVPADTKLGIISQTCVIFPAMLGSSDRFSGHMRPRSVRGITERSASPWWYQTKSN